MSKDESSGSTSAVEVTARTVDEAIARGLVRLGGLSRSEVDIEVLQEGKPGLLGFGAEEAVVRLTPQGKGKVTRPSSPPPAQAPSGATTAADAQAPSPGGGGSGGGADTDAAPPKRRRRRRRRRGKGGSSSEGAQQTAPQEAQERAGGMSEETQAPAPTPARAEADTPEESPRREPRPAVTPTVAEGDAEAKATAVCGDLLRHLGYPEARIELQAGLLPEDMEDDDPATVLSIRGGGSERLLTRDAEPLYALQFLTRMVVSQQTGEWTHVLLDVDGDRRRRVKELVAMAEQSADLVERDGRPVSLPPMSAYDRRVVHIALRDHPSIITQSIGQGDRRKITVRRVDQMLPELG